MPSAQCPLCKLDLFQAHEPAEIDRVQSRKRRDLRLPTGHALIQEDQVDAPLYTLQPVWAFRFKTLSDGRRQILNDRHGL